MQTMMSVCVVSPNAYGEMTSRESGHIGGTERQTSLLAKWLATRGYRVSMVTWDEGQEDGAEIDGVRVIKMCRQGTGIPGLRMFHPRWTSLNRALRTADADIYYYNRGDMGLGQIVLWCRRHGRKTVFSTASNADCDTRFAFLRDARERLLYRYGLARVDRVIVQTRHQQDILKRNFGIDSTVIFLPCPGPQNQDNIPCRAVFSDTPTVLWIGRFSREKRLEWLLDLAERLPDVRFNVLGAANVQSAYAEKLRLRAGSIPNVEIHGRIPRECMSEFYSRTTLLCCTSIIEGYPNTFLEAWSHGLPIVSTFDPDGVIVTRRLGWIGRQVDELAAHIRQALTSPQAWQAASQAARDYYLRYHTIEKTLPLFEKVFLEVYENTSS